MECGQHYGAHCEQQQLEGKCNCSFVTALLLKPAILDLLDKPLNVAAVRVLVQGDWLHMQCLQLSASCLHVEAIQYLATADWPNEQILGVEWHWDCHVRHAASRLGEAAQAQHAENESNCCQKFGF